MLEAVPLTNVETTTCRDALINNWIARFGVPAHLTSDQGPSSPPPSGHAPVRS